MEMIYDLTDYIDRYRGYGVSRDEFHAKYNHLSMADAHYEISNLVKISENYVELLYALELGFMDQVYQNFTMRSMIEAPLNKIIRENSTITELFIRKPRSRSVVFYTLISEADADAFFDILKKVDLIDPKTTRLSLSTSKPISVLEHIKDSVKLSIIRTSVHFNKHLQKGRIGECNTCNLESAIRVMGDLLAHKDVHLISKYINSEEDDEYLEFNDFLNRHKSAIEEHYNKHKPKMPMMKAAKLYGFV